MKKQNGSGLTCKGLRARLGNLLASCAPKNVLLAVFCAAGLAGGKAFAVTTNTFTLSLDCTQLGATNIPGNFIGLSLGRGNLTSPDLVFDPTWNPGTATNTWQQYTNILGQIGVHHWRTILNSCDDVPSPTPQELTNFFTTLQDSGCTNVIFSFNCFTNNDANAPLAITIESDPQWQSMIESFALDNEPNSGDFQVPKYSYTEADYEQQWYLCYTQIEYGIAGAGFPWAPFSGPDNASAIPPNPGQTYAHAWNPQFPIDFAGYRFFKMATQHDYDSACSSNSPDALGMAITNLSPDRVAMWGNVYSNELMGTNTWPWNYNHTWILPYRMTEASPYNNGENNVANTNGQTFSTALWGLDFCNWWALHRCSGVNPFSRVVDDNSPISLDSASGNYTAMPYAYGLLAFNLMSGQGQGWPVTSVTFGSGFNSMNMTAYGVLANTNLYIALINKTFNHVGAVAANVTVKAPTGFAKPTSAKYMLLSSVPAGQDGDVTILQTAYLGGSTITNVGQWNGTWTPMTISSGGQVTNLVQPGTAVIIDLQN